MEAPSEAVEDKLVELVSVDYPGGVRSLKVRLRTTSVDFDMDELMVTASFFVMSSSGFELSDARREIEWQTWDDDVSGKEQLLLQINQKSPFDRVEIELHFEGKLIERATYDWPQS